MPPVGFELTILAGEQPQTYDLDRAATGTGEFLLELENFETNVVEKIKTRIFCALTFSRTWCGLWDIVEKYGRARQTTDGICMPYN